MGKNIDKILVVLCPGSPNNNGNFYEVEYNKIYQKNLYLGGEVRMCAAVKLSIKKEWKCIILVGGSGEKVRGMQNYILRRIKDKRKIEQKIICLESDPDTNGNLSAINMLFSIKDIEKKMYFLSNKYHIRRIRRFAKDIFIGLKTKLSKSKFLEAEKYSISPFHYKEERNNRKKIEKKGIDDWNKGIYRDQYKEDLGRKCIVHDPQRLKDNIVYKKGLYKKDQLSFKQNI